MAPFSGGRHIAGLRRRRRWLSQAELGPAASQPRSARQAAGGRRLRGWQGAWPFGAQGKHSATGAPLFLIPASS